MKDSKFLAVLSVLVFILLVADIFKDDIKDNLITAKNILSSKATSALTTISIYVDPDTPTIFIASPLNKTYNYNNSIHLNFTVIDSTLDKIYYNIDDGSNTTITSNTTFSVASNQSQCLEVEFYACIDLILKHFQSFQHLSLSSSPRAVIGFVCL